MPFETVTDAHPLVFRGGRFVLFDGRSVAAARSPPCSPPEHVAIDVDTLRRGEPFDPFAALIDTRSRHAASWTVGSMNADRAGVATCPRRGSAAG